MDKWYEIKIITMRKTFEEWKSTRPDVQVEIAEAESERKFNLVRSLILPAIEEFRIEEYHFFNYLEQVGDNIESYMRLRVYTNDEHINKIITRLEEFKRKGKVHDFKQTDYSPKEDAKERATKGAPQRLRDLVLPDILKAGRWVVKPEEPEEKIKSFEKVLRKVVGKCAVAFIREFDKKPKDAWLMSVFVHLLLNSLGYSLEEERKIRQFPAI
jgi:hypothetical protein